MAFPDRATFRALARESNRIPVYRELFADTETPVSVLGKLGADGNVLLLESVTGGEQLARYSFIGHSPSFVLTTRGRRLWLEQDGRSTQRVLGEGESPLTALRAQLANERQAHLPGLPRFTGGAVGYVGYDAVRFFERLPDAPTDDLGVPDCLMAGIEELIVFDHVTMTMKVLVNQRVDGDPDAAYDEALRRISRTTDRLRAAAPVSGVHEVVRRASDRPATLPEGVSSNLDRPEYVRAVERSREYIAAGDVIQVVLSQRFSRRVQASPYEVYRALRVVNPSPYMYYLAFGGMHIVGSSPEILVTENEGEVRVRPIAGTRRRGATPEEDAALEAELLADEKERAEHIMLVDLGRNDLGRVCEYGSVRVDELMVVERYSHVMHIVSNVVGRLAPGRDQFDVLAATFPAGTVSGAPKVRAMEIIDELEPTRRGVYAGAIGYFGFSGSMDTCIAIRTIVIDRGVAHVQAGSGLVADSDPDREYEECLNKAAAMFRAIELAEEGER